MNRGRVQHSMRPCFVCLVFLIHMNSHVAEGPRECRMKKQGVGLTNKKIEFKNEIEFVLTDEEQVKRNHNDEYCHEGGWRTLYGRKCNASRTNKASLVHHSRCYLRSDNRLH